MFGDDLYLYLGQLARRSLRYWEGEVKVVRGVKVEVLLLTLVLSNLQFESPCYQDF